MQPHGRVTIRWQGPILRVQSSGLFNKEGLAVTLKKYQAAVLEAGTPCWLQLDVWGEHTLGTPSALDGAAEIYQWGSAHGCRAFAVVVRNSIQAGVVEKMASMLSVPLRHFSSEAEALAWLQSLNNAESSA